MRPFCRTIAGDDKRDALARMPRHDCAFALVGGTRAWSSMKPMNSVGRYSPPHPGGLTEVVIPGETGLLQSRQRG